jgi:hypothetical protein
MMIMHVCMRCIAILYTIVRIFLLVLSVEVDCVYLIRCFHAVYAVVQFEAR